MPWLFRLALILITSTSLTAQASYFGVPAPLTNTRYGALTGKPILATNGSETFAFLVSGRSVRMTRLADAQRNSRFVADTDGDADVVWTGSNFLVAATQGGAIIGRFVDATGNARAPFTLIDQGSKPRLGVSGDRIQLLYEHEGVQSQLFTLNGVKSGVSPALAIPARDFDASGDTALLAMTGGVMLVRNGVQTRVSTDVASEVSLAMNGSDGVAAWTSDGVLHAATITNGVAAAAVEIASHATAPSALWNGAKYEIAYRADGLRIADLSGASNALVIHGEADQTLVATASLPNATLFVWNEGDESRIGIRNANRSWRERVLGSRAIAAASGGNAFVVITSDTNGWSATWLDESGAILRQSSAVASFTPRNVAMNANDAIVVGEANGNVVAARSSRDGSIAAPVTLRTNGKNPAIASDGTNFFVVWTTPQQTLEGVRVDSSAQRLDENDAMVFEAEVDAAAIAFNGHEYVLAWNAGTFLRGRRVKKDGTVVRELVQSGRAGGNPVTDVQLASVGDAMAMTWFDGRAQALLFDFSDGWNVRTTKAFDSRSGAAPRAASLPNGGFALLHTDASMNVPHDGSTRIGMSVAHPAPAIAPDAPRIQAAFANGKLQVSWAAQAVNGYRVETRIDEGSWFEQEGWADGDASSASFDVRRSGTYSVRVRAWSDGGVSAYSQVVSVPVTVNTRRRAVR
ncbi:MAG: fibronectin type III domain-containing protein [Acidobacteriota bacterium]|nr:fibronectin type III domain-containing protein [Acidobacteriota bacterium]